jgi:hypothetical protein
MHSLLVTTVLVSGLAVGDGGRGGAPAAAARVDFSGVWVGTWERSGDIRARLIIAGGKACLLRDGACVMGGPPEYRCSLVAEGPTTVRVTFGEAVIKGTYRIKGCEVRISLGEGNEWALTRYQPKK